MELVRRVEPAQLSWTKTSYILEQAQDLFAEQDAEQSQPRAREAEPHKITSERRYAQDGEGASRAQSMRAAMMIKATAYHEIAQLCEAIFSIWEFRHVANSITGRDAQGVSNSEDEVRLKESLDEVKATMEPLLQAHFLTTASSTILLTREEVAEQLGKIREAYLPELVMAYLSALVFTANALSVREGRQAAVDGVELANAVAENKELCRCFQARGRMRELMDGLALCSRALLKCNEDSPLSKTTKSKKRSKGPNKTAVWDVSGK